MNNLISCQAGVGIKCTKQGLSNQMFRLKWEGSDKYLDVCPSCFEYIQMKQLKYMDIKKETLKNALYYEEGVRPVDIKSYLEKWIKQTKNEL